jgi:hypothetical protein
MPIAIAMRPVLLAVGQEFGEGTALRVAPELADPIGTRRCMSSATPSGASHLTPLTSGDLHERAVEAGVVPPLPSCRSSTVRPIARRPEAPVGSDLQRCEPGRIWDRTTELLSNREFQRRVGVLESALYSRPATSGAEVALLPED